MVPGSDVQGSSTVGVTIWKKELGGNRDMLKFLKTFHHQAKQHILGMTAKHGASGEWEYPVVEESMDYAGIHPIGVYIKMRQIKIVERVACPPVYELCREPDGALVGSRRG